MANELLPCPFCGGPAEIYNPFHMIGKPSQPATYRGGVRCRACGCESKATTPPDGAITTWNRRADAAPQASAESVDLPGIDADRLRTIAASGSQTAMTNALLNVARALKQPQATVVDKSANLQGSQVDGSTEMQGQVDGGQQRAGDGLPAFMQSRMTPWGLLVRACRIVVDTTLMDMSRELGIRPSSLSAYEHGRKGLNDDFLIEVMRFFEDRGLCIPATAWRKAAIAATQPEQGERDA